MVNIDIIIIQMVNYVIILILKMVSKKVKKIEYEKI